MPYCYIWASFILNGTTLEKTRWTNGCIEKYFATKKNIEKTYLNMLPAHYVNYNYEIRLGECIKFQKLIDDNNVKPSSKLAKPTTSMQQPSSFSDSESNENQQVEQFESAPSQSVDVFKKKPEKSDLIKIGLKHHKVGHYQAASQLKPDSVAQQSQAHLSDIQPNSQYTRFIVKSNNASRRNIHNDFVYKLSFKCVKDLLSEAWLTDTIIESYLMSIEFEKEMSIFMFPIEIANKIILQGKNPLLEERNLVQYQHLFGLLNKEHHFTCFYIQTTDYFETATFSYIDPLGANDEESALMFNNWL